MKLRVLVVASLAPLVLAVLVVSSALAGDGNQGTAMKRLRGVNFVSACTFTHRAPDDPIVFFGRPGASHDHSFVGNTSTNASSTLESLLAAGTTCHRPGDTAAYWMPTLLVDGRPVMPVHARGIAFHDVAAARDAIARFDFAPRTTPVVSAHVMGGAPFGSDTRNSDPSAK